MADFTVRYRRSDGGIGTVQVEAADRAGVFAELKERGISAISVSEASNTGDKAPSRRMPFFVVIGLAVGVVSLALIIAMKHQPTSKTTAKNETTTSIPVTDPAVVPTQHESPDKTETSTPQSLLQPQRIGETRDGKVLLPDGTLHVVKGVITSGVARVSIVDRTFKHYTDCMLAHILTAKPGDGFVGDSASMYDGFEKEFLKTIADPIEFNDDDDDYVRELKSGVLALRQELKDIYDRGGSVENALIETRDQLLQLGLYRNELERQVLEMSADGMSQQDYENLVSAANKMLEERGCKPLELPSSVKHAIYIGTLMKNSENKGEQK